MMDCQCGKKCNNFKWRRQFGSSSSTRCKMWQGVVATAAAANIVRLSMRAAGGGRSKWQVAVATSSTAGSQCRLTCHAACSKRQAASSSALRKFNSVPQKFENFVNKTLRCALCCRREARRSGAGQSGAGGDETRLCRTFGNSKKESKRRICQLQCAPKLRQTLKGIWHCFQLGFSCGSQRSPAQRRLCRGFTVHTASDAHPVSCCCCTKFATRQMVLVVAAAAAACAKLASSVAQLLQGGSGEGARIGQSTTTTMLSSIVQRMFASAVVILAATVLVVLLVSWQSFRRARRLPFAVLMR